MSVSLLEVIEAGGYDLTTVEDANWLLSKRSEFEELIEEAQELVDEAQAKEDFYGVTPIRVKAPYTFPEAITVQVKDEDGEVLECNHAGAEEQTYYNDRYSYDLEDVLQDEYKALTCDKCGAVYNELNEEWRSE